MKTIYIVYCALITLAAFSAPASADMVGDANNDGRITTADSLIALQMSVGSVAPDLERADVSGDGRINSLDALMILTMAQKTQVCVDAPDVVSGTFNVTINIYNAVDLDSGMFDLSFNSSVVNVTAVYNGTIDGTTVPIDSWNFTDADTIHVDLNSTGGVSGFGLLATISFDVLGEVWDSSILDISGGQIADTGSNNTPALWFDSDVTVGVPVTVNAPEVALVTSGTFNVTIDIENVLNLNAGQFDLSFDSSVVNVTDVENGLVNDKSMRIDEWKFMDSDTIRVISKRPGDYTVSGSGHLATVNFAITGSQGNTSILDISDGKLAGIPSEGTTDAEEIPAIWLDSEVAVGVPVTVNASEVVLVTSGTFNVTIDIENVLNMNAGQFDLSFDSSVVNVTDVEKGLVNGKTMRIDEWKFMDSDTIRVISKRPGDYTVSGSGHLAVINFAITGSQGNTSILDISDGKLAGILSEGTTDAEEIPATWTDAEVAVGVPVTVNAPDVASGTFDVTIDIESVLNLNAGQFDLSFDSSVVNVTDVENGLVNDKSMRIDEWKFMDSDTIRVISKRPGDYTVNGSGHLAVINFVVTGSGTSLLDISDGKLAGIPSEGTTDAEEIPATWTDDEVTA